MVMGMAGRRSPKAVEQQIGGGVRSTARRESRTGVSFVWAGWSVGGGRDSRGVWSFCFAPLNRPSGVVWCLISVCPGVQEMDGRSGSSQLLVAQVWVRWTMGERGMRMVDDWGVSDAPAGSEHRRACTITIQRCSGRYLPMDRSRWMAGAWHPLVDS